MLKISRGRDTMRFADGNDAVAGAAHLAVHSHGGRTMKKLFTIAVAVLLSLGVASLGYAQAPKTEKKTEKKADGKMVEKKTEKSKTDKKESANPCAAKAAEKK